MTGLSVLLLGIGLGLRHATDADHVVVVSDHCPYRTAVDPGFWNQMLLTYATPISPKQRRN